MKIIRFMGWLLGLVLVVIVAGAIWAYLVSGQKLATTYPFTPVKVALPTDAAAIEEGRRLATFRGCNGCHGKRGEGTVLFDDPKIARIVAPNLTAAAKKYDDAQLAGIVRSGVRPDGRSMVVMPSQEYLHLTDEDLGRILAWMRSLPPTDGLSPAFEVGPLGRVGIATGKLKVVAEEIKQGREPAAAKPGSIEERGRYLARTTCAECHATDLHGKTTPAYVSTDLRVVAAYDLEAFKTLLRKGVAIGGRELPFMGPTSRNHLAAMNDAEVEALFAYLKGTAGAP